MKSTSHAWLFNLCLPRHKSEKNMTKLPVVHAQLQHCSIWNEMVSLIWTGFYNINSFSFDLADQKTVMFPVGLKLTSLFWLSAPAHSGLIIEEVLYLKTYYKQHQRPSPLTQLSSKENIFFLLISLPMFSLKQHKNCFIWTSQLSY